MGKPLQIRDVPEDVLSALKAKAESEHLSLAAYALRVLEREARMPSVGDVLGRPGSRTTATRGEIVALVRADRESR